jgi:hypothetical protein
MDSPIELGFKSTDNLGEEFTYFPTVILNDFGARYSSLMAASFTSENFI